MTIEPFETPGRAARAALAAEAERTLRVMAPQDVPYEIVFRAPED